MTGPKGEFVLVFSVHFIIALGIVMNSIFEAPFFWTRVSPLLAVSHILLFFLAWSLLLLTQYSDPGILLRTLL